METNKNEEGTKDFSSGVKDVDRKKGIISGYFADFGSLDSDGDVIRQGAFTKTINDNGPMSKQPRIKHLLNHDIEKPLGLPLTLTEDTKGLYYESKIGSHNLGQDFLKMVDSGLISEHSIGYRTIKSKPLREDYKEGEAMRELTELKLYEGSSLTAWGANPNTPITGVKNWKSTEEIIEKSIAIEKFCRDSTATDETIEMLLEYNRQLKQLIKEPKITQEPASTQVIEPQNSTLPEPKITPSEVVKCPNCGTKNKRMKDKKYLRCSSCGCVSPIGSNLIYKPRT